MNISEYFEKIKIRLKELWTHKVLRYAIIIHLFYFILSIILFFTVFYELNDFRAFYHAGSTFISDINELYSQANYNIHFRYLPLSALLYIPFTFFGFDIGYILFSTCNLILTLLCCIILYKIIMLIQHNSHEKQETRPLMYISLFLMSLPHVDNYILGQINLYILVLVLISLYIFLKHDDLKWQIIGSVVLGMSINIKPTTIFLIPFILMINFNLTEKKIHFDMKKTLIRIIFVTLPVLLNFILFFMNNQLWTGFINNNFGGNRTLEINFSFSITKLLINFFEFYNIDYNHSLIFMICLVVIGGFGFLIFIFARQEKNLIIYGFTIGMIITLLVYYDSWDHHLLTLTPLLIMIIFNLPRDSKTTNKIIKPSLLFFSFLDLAFLGIWYLTQYWFPFNFGSTIFLILTLYGICRYCLNKENMNSV